MYFLAFRLVYQTNSFNAFVRIHIHIGIRIGIRIRVDSYSFSHSDLNLDSDFGIYLLINLCRHVLVLLFLNLCNLLFMFIICFTRCEESFVVAVVVGDFSAQLIYRQYIFHVSVGHSELGINYFTLFRNVCFSCCCCYCCCCYLFFYARDLILCFAFVRLSACVCKFFIILNLNKLNFISKN